MANRNRPVQVIFRCTPEERAMIDKRMAQLGTTNMAAYLRKMALDGYCVNMDFSDIRELVSLLRRCSNNLNQYAKKANETGSIYAEDIQDLQTRLNEIREGAKEIMARLATIS